MSYEKVLWDFYARRGICTHVDHKKITAQREKNG